MPDSIQHSDEYSAEVDLPNPVSACTTVGTPTIGIVLIKQPDSHTTHIVQFTNNEWVSRV